MEEEKKLDIEKFAILVFNPTINLNVESLTDVQLNILLDSIKGIHNIIETVEKLSHNK